MASVRRTSSSSSSPRGRKVFCLIPRNLGAVLELWEQAPSHPPPQWPVGFLLWMGKQAPRGSVGLPAWPPGWLLHPVPPAEAPCGLLPTEESSEVRAHSPCPVPGLLAGCCLTHIQPVGRVYPCPFPPPARMAAASSSCCHDWMAHVRCLLRGQVILELGRCGGFAAQPLVLCWAVASYVPVDAEAQTHTSRRHLLDLPRCFSH